MERASRSAQYTIDDNISAGWRVNPQINCAQTLRFDVPVMIGCALLLWLLLLRQRLHWCAGLLLLLLYAGYLAYQFVGK